MVKQAPMYPSPETDAIAALLGVVPDAISPCTKGGNNRVLRVDAGGQTYLAKYYFQSAHDTRRRMEYEWAFLSYAKLADVPCVPRPIAKDDSGELAIYTFLDGRVPAAEEITPDAVRQAGELIANINRSKDTPAAQALPAASESCFTAADHTDLLRTRLEKLATHDALPEHTDAFHATYRQMQEAFARYARLLAEGYAGLGLALHEPVTRSQRCLSPSDFGFHNSLRTANGQYAFIDFEYAGWDDPAKLLCDFLLHPGIPVNHALLPRMLAQLDASKGVDIDLPSAISRARLLYPLLALRWCCIILNVFVPEYAARRQFADSTWDKASAQGQQLAKAQYMLQLMTSNPF